MKEVDYTFDNCYCECDNCGYSENIDSRNYTDINKELKESGWVIRNIEGEWCDFCSYKCYNEYIN